MSTSQRLSIIVLVVAVLSAMAVGGQFAFADATSTNFKTDNVTLSPGEPVDITVETTGVDATATGIQLNIQHPDSLTVTGPECIGIFAGGLVLSGSVDGGTAIGCVLTSGAVSGTSGDVISFTLTSEEAITTDQTISILVDATNPLATEFRDAEGRIDPGITNQLRVSPVISP